VLLNGGIGQFADLSDLASGPDLHALLITAMRNIFLKRRLVCNPSVLEINRHA
jgi:hypothetical protein